MDAVAVADAPSQHVVQFVDRLDPDGRLVLEAVGRVVAECTEAAGRAKVLRQTVARRAITEGDAQHRAAESRVHRAALQSTLRVAEEYVVAAGR